MDRFEAREDKTIEELISTAERGVEVELTRDGKVLARVVSAPEPMLERPKSDWLVALEKRHASLPADFPRTGWSETLPAARDEDPFQRSATHRCKR